MFAEIGALWIDHVAVTTKAFKETARHYLAMPNARVLRGPGWNSAQKVHFLFVSFGGDLCIEILGLPEDGDSPIAGHVNNGGGAYHLCHAVADLDTSLAAATRAGCRIVVPARSDDAFDGRRVAFLMHPAHGLFELVEAYGKLKAVMPAHDLGKAPASADIQFADEELQRGLKTAFANIFRESLPAEIADWTIEKVEAWDSLQHLRLAMEIERCLDVALPSHMLGELKSFDDFLQALKAHTRD